jgi:hypothetical protein
VRGGGYRGQRGPRCKLFRDGRFDEAAGLCKRADTDIILSYRDFLETHAEVLELKIATPDLADAILGRRRIVVWHPDMAFWLAARRGQIVQFSLGSVATGYSLETSRRIYSIWNFLAATNEVIT